MPALVSRALLPGDRQCRRPPTSERTDHEDVVYNRGRLSPAGDGRANAAGRTIGAGDRQGRGGSRRQAAVRADAPGAPPMARATEQGPSAVVAVRRDAAVSGGSQPPEAAAARPARSSRVDSRCVGRGRTRASPACLAPDYSVTGCGATPRPVSAAAPQRAANATASCASSPAPRANVRPAMNESPQP